MTEHFIYKNPTSYTYQSPACGNLPKGTEHDSPKSMEYVTREEFELLRKIVKAHQEALDIAASAIKALSYSAQIKP